MSLQGDYHRNTEPLMSPIGGQKMMKLWAQVLIVFHTSASLHLALTEQPTVPSCLAACTCVFSVRSIDILDGARFGSTGPLETDWQGLLRLELLVTMAVEVPR